MKGKGSMAPQSSGYLPVMAEVSVEHQIPDSPRIGAADRGITNFIATDAGRLVLASDATHYYENFETGRPFPIAFDIGAMLEAFTTVRALADEPDLVVPGHDPLVLERFEVAGECLDGIAVRLDRPLPRT